MRATVPKVLPDLLESPSEKFEFNSWKNIDYNHLSFALIVAWLCTWAFDSASLWQPASPQPQPTTWLCDQFWHFSPQNRQFWTAAESRNVQLSLATAAADGAVHTKHRRLPGLTRFSTARTLSGSLQTNFTPTLTFARNFLSETLLQRRAYGGLKDKHPFRQLDSASKMAT